MSDLAHLDAEIWGEDEDGEAADPFNPMSRSLEALAVQFKGLADKLDAQSTTGQSTVEQVRVMNATLAAILSAQATTIKAISELSEAMTAPRRIIKDKDGKPVGVEIKRA